MSKDLTKKQKEILNFIENFIQTNSYPPTLNEIAINFQITSKAIYDHIKALSKKKYLYYKPKKSRSIKLLYLNSKTVLNHDDNLSEIPVIGRVQAGLPILSYENFDKNIKISKSIFGDGKIFALKIQGDSMINEGIYEGDIAVVKCVSHFNNGEIIIADTKNGITIKKAYKDKEFIRLEPANDDFKTLYEKEIRMIGKLIGLIRRY